MSRTHSVAFGHCCTCTRAFNGSFHIFGCKENCTSRALPTNLNSTNCRLCVNKTRLRVATSLRCITAALGQADLPSSYCRSWYRLLASSTVNGGHSCPWQKGGPSRTVGRSSTFKLISLLAEVPVKTAVQRIASHTCDIFVSVMLTYGLLARKALRCRARPRRYTRKWSETRVLPFLSVIFYQSAHY